MALMANHVHLIVTPPTSAALPLFVKLFAQRYAQLRNGDRDSSGKLFEQRYVCVVMRDEEQLAIATVYVDLNPKRAGLVDDPLRYPWSTYAIHAGQPHRCAIPLALWTPSRWYAGLGGDTVECAARYRREVAFLESHRPPSVSEKLGASVECKAGRYVRRVRRPDRRTAR